MVGASEDERFEAFVVEAEPRLRRALVAAYGHEQGRDAAAEALAYAWEHWSEVSTMANAIGFLYRVGQSRTRSRRAPRIHVVPTWSDPMVEPGLGPALSRLSERQRLAVVLVHGFGWTMREVAEVTGLAVTSIQNHLERGLAHLRDELEVRDDV
jgi:DNA-directed RNA polymerase specialized sigma24 family protein